VLTRSTAFPAAARLSVWSGFAAPFFAWSCSYAALVVPAFTPVPSVLVPVVALLLVSILPLTIVLSTVGGPLFKGVFVKEKTSSFDFTNHGILSPVGRKPAA
jgi:hypothetical protein